MLTLDKANEFQVVDKLPANLISPSFSQKRPLWIKGNHPTIDSSDILGKRYQYIKIGKTFGFQTTRYIAYHDAHLFYYDGEKDANFIGYCPLDNVYTQWARVKSGKLMLLLTNNSESSYFFFNHSAFKDEVWTMISRNVIQIDFKEKYEVIDQIGKGSFSKVYRVKNLVTKKQFAAKAINKKDKHKSCTKGLVIEQRKILKLISSPYVYRFEQLYEQDEFYIMILEYLPGKDLMALFKQKKVGQPQIALFLLRQILQGLKDIHKAGIVHRDLKPQNILVDLTTLKPYIIDFGLSLDLNESLTSKSFKRCGTMGYMAPEVIQNTGQFKKPYGSKVDIFSFGIISHMLLLGYNPLKGENYDQTFNKNKICDIELDKIAINSRYGEHCFIFLTKTLSKYPQFRYDSEQALGSPFLNEKPQQKERDKEQSSSTFDQRKKVYFQSNKTEK